MEEVEATTVSIFPDEAHKDVKALEVEVPRLSAGYTIKPKLEAISVDEVREAFQSRFRPIPVAEEVSSDIDYEGRHLFTGEIVERMKLHIELLETGYGAIAYYRKQLEQACKVQQTHTVLAPLLEAFFEEILFEEKLSLFDQRLIARLGDADVEQYVRAVFVPLIRERVTEERERLPKPAPMRLSSWRPFQVTHGSKKQAHPAEKTLFNLVPCDRGLEVTMNRFLDRAPDVVAFAKNAGPQALRIDYLAQGHRLAFYTPDFFARGANGEYWLIETKGRVDLDVPVKARAAIEWCRSATGKAVTWRYLYVPQGVFNEFNGTGLRELDAACGPALQNLVQEEVLQERLPLFAATGYDERGELEPKVAGFVEAEVLEPLSDRAKKAVRDAILLFRFMENKKDMNYAPALNALLGPLDAVSRRVLKQRLQDEMPTGTDEQKRWFFVGDRYLTKDQSKLATNLKQTLVFNGGYSPIGLLRWCLEYANGEDDQAGGVFAAVRRRFRSASMARLLEDLTELNDFRNHYVAHQEQTLEDKAAARDALQHWVETLGALSDMSKRDVVVP
ncbi:hypothetical protein GF324_08395 [bacterium]|nr:hypothetical protein [bacterium]